MECIPEKLILSGSQCEIYHSATLQKKNSHEPATCAPDSEAKLVNLVVENVPTSNNNSSNPIPRIVTVFIAIDVHFSKAVHCE